jgi:hypothetical protein
MYWDQYTHMESFLSPFLHNIESFGEQRAKLEMLILITTYDLRLIQLDWLFVTNNL